MVYIGILHLVILPHMFSTRIHQARNARSNGQPVMLERTWKRAWHGSSLHRIEEIAQKGLKVGKKGSLGHWELDLPKDSENGLATAWWKDEGNGRRINWVERTCFGSCSVRWVQSGRFHLCFQYEACLWELLLCLDSSVWLLLYGCCIAASFSCWLLHQWICLLPRFNDKMKIWWFGGLSSCWDDLHHVMMFITAFCLMTKVLELVPSRRGCQERTLARNPKVRY